MFLIMLLKCEHCCPGKKINFVGRWYSCFILWRPHFAPRPCKWLTKMLGHSRLSPVTAFTMELLDGRPLCRRNFQAEETFHVVLDFIVYSFVWQLFTEGLPYIKNRSPSRGIKRNIHIQRSMRCVAWESHCEELE